MNENVKEYVAEKVNDLIHAPSCCAEAKAAAQNWLENEFYRFAKTFGYALHVHHA